MLSNPLRFLRCLLFLSCILYSRASAQAQAPTAAVIAPFLDEHTLLVARIDLRQVDPAALVKTIGGLAPPTDTEFPKQLAGLEQRMKGTLQALATAGISELYAVVSMSDFPKEPVFVVAPVKAGGDTQQAANVLREVLRFEANDARPGAAVVGTKTIIERLKKVQPAPRPEFAKGLERAGDAPIQLVLAPSDDTRRVVREMLPRLPDEIGGGSGKMLADGLSWATVAVKLPPRLSLSIVIQSRSVEAAAALRGTIVSALQILTREPKVRQQWPGVDDFTRLMTPRLSGEQLVLTLSDKADETEQALRLLAAPLQAARAAAGSARSMNNLKHFGLAMHNYHDTHKHFPPQAIRGKDGKALLSWRVAVLPFLDAESLYKQFKLDEPWDSEHNRKLIEKMPAVLASPSLGDGPRSKGMTSYLAPLTRQPPAIAEPLKDESKAPAGPSKDQMVFDIVQGTTFAKITDGTSNTLLILEAHPKSAVVWTKPDDLVINDSDPVAALRGQPHDGFNVLFGDGSVRFLRTSIDPKTFLHLLQMNDGNPIGEF